MGVGMISGRMVNPSIIAGEVIAEVKRQHALDVAVRKFPDIAYYAKDHLDNLEFWIWATGDIHKIRNEFRRLMERI